MLTLLGIFFLTGGISFIGSLPPGPVNTMVIYTARHKSPARARSLALGGSLPELLYAGLVTYFSSWLFAFGHWYLQGLFACMLMGIGISLMRPSALKSPDVPLQPDQGRAFLQGLLLGLLNVQLPLFWMGAWVAYPQFFLPSVLAGWPAKVSFMLGAMAGAWGLLWGLSWLASLPIPSKTRAWSWLRPQSLGLMTLGFGIWQAGRLLF